jgi:hypothetical protein
VRVFGWQTRVRNESEPRSMAVKGRQNGPIIYFDRFELEHTCWDPKDGELCLDRMKPEETLVEVRSRSDVQIDGQIWV